MQFSETYHNGTVFLSAERNTPAMLWGGEVLEGSCRRLTLAGILEG